MKKRGVVPHGIAPLYISTKPFVNKHRLWYEYPLSGMKAGHVAIDIFNSNMYNGKKAHDYLNSLPGA